MQPAIERYVKRTRKETTELEHSTQPIAPFLGGPDAREGRRALFGQPAPDFELKDEEGKGVTLRRLTRRGPLLLHLYRGNW